MSSENETETTDTTNNDEPTLKDVMRALQSSADREKEIKLTLNKIESRLVSLEVLKATVIDVEKSQKFLSGQCKDLETKVNTVDKNNKELKAENVFLNNKVKDLSRELENEKYKRNQLEQYGRREMLEISGIPQNSNENCVMLVHKLCDITDSNIKVTKIEVAHRIKNGDIIVKFKDRPSRDTLYNNKYNLKNKSAKDLGFDTENSIFVNESLSFDTRYLMFETRKKCKTLGYKKIITDNGVIKVKVDDGNGVTWWRKIKSLKDLDELK